MNAGPEARHENDDKNEIEDGSNARLLGPTSAGQRIEDPPLTAGEGEGGGALPAPSGIICLCVIAGRHQCSADPVQLTRALGLNLASAVTEDYLKLKEDLVQNRQDAAAEQRTIEEDQAALTQAEQSLDSGEARPRDLYHDLAQRVTDEPALKGDFDKSKKLYALEWLRSPVDGVVQSVNVTTVGQVVTAAQSLVTVVPDGTPLIVEATVSNNDIGYIKVGQPVQVKVDTFAFQKYGTIPGTLVWISR